MAEWLFSDGTVLRSGGEVAGASPVAEDLRQTIETSKGKWPYAVVVAPLPNGYWPLDADSDFTLNALANGVAVHQKLTLTTEYVEGDDVPDQVREMRAFESVEGRIY